MIFSASASVDTFAHSTRSEGVRKYASGDFAQSLYFVICARATAAKASAARAIPVLFTVPPQIRSSRLRSVAFYRRKEASAVRTCGPAGGQAAEWKSSHGPRGLRPRTAGAGASGGGPVRESAASPGLEDGLDGLAGLGPDGLTARGS